MGNQHMRTERPEIVEMFERATVDLHQRTLHGGEMFVDMALEQRARARRQRRCLAKHVTGRCLGDGNRQRGMNENIVVPACDMRLGARQNRIAVHHGSVPPEIVADETEHAAQTRFLCRPCNGRDVTFGARSGVDHRREPAAQGLQRGRLGGQIDEFVVEHPLQRHPDAAEYLGRFTERERLAKRLGQMMVRIDEARHQKLAGQRKFGNAGVA